MGQFMCPSIERIEPWPIAGLPVPRCITLKRNAKLVNNVSEMKDLDQSDILM